MVRSLEALHQHIIHINLHSFANVVDKHFVDKPLVGSSSIRQVERQDFVTIKASIGNEGSVFLV